MTRRERAIARLERRLEWAASRRAKADAAFNGVQQITSMIPLGQPILVGHHSERRARRDAERIDNGMRRGCESLDMAKHHESKAAGIERQLENTVFSDDPDAIEALKAKIAEGRADLERMKAGNKIIRKFKKSIPERKAELVASGLFNEAQAEKLFTPDCFGGLGFASYQLTNLGANIRRMEKRIAEIKTRNARAEKAEAAGGVIIEGSGDYVRVTFSEKPSREVLNALRTAGFHWGGGSWSGRRDSLPECVKPELQDVA